MPKGRENCLDIYNGPFKYLEQTHHNSSVGYVIEGSFCLFKSILMNERAVADPTDRGGGGGGVGGQQSFLNRSLDPPIKNSWIRP